MSLEWRVAPQETATDTEPLVYAGIEYPTVRCQKEPEPADSMLYPVGYECQVCGWSSWGWRCEGGWRDGSGGPLEANGDRDAAFHAERCGESRHLTVGDDDYLVVRHPRILSQEAVARLTRAIEEMVPGTKVLVLDEGVTLDVIRKGAQD